MLSVSSNGSNWVKHAPVVRKWRCWPTFSILERIELGETLIMMFGGGFVLTFSILERIELGETILPGASWALDAPLSVSSNGSNWVKHSRTEEQHARKKLSVSSNGSNWVKPD